MPLIIWKGRTDLVPQVEFGRLSLADRDTLTDVYRGFYNLCIANAVPRGTFGSGLRAGFVCASSTVDPEKGGSGKLTINWEAGGPFATLPLPSDDFNLEALPQYPRVERSKFYSGITTVTLALVYQAAQGSTPIARGIAVDQIEGLADATQKALALSLLKALTNGQETFYMAAWKYTWISFSYLFPSLFLGGVIQAPLGPLSGAFPTNTALRLCDEVQPAGVNGSMFKIMRIWIVAQAGYWNPDIQG